MVDDVNIMETAESKASEEALDRARLAREKREAEQRKRLEELRAHAAAAQAQREKRDDERRRRLADQRAKDDDRRSQVEERKRAIWEASVSRREALLQREKDRMERLERARAARSAPRPAFAFGSSTPRLLEPLDNGGFFWAARRAASTSNVMFASAPLTRRASALHLDSDTDNKDEGDRQPAAAAWSSVARRRTDLVPTLPASRAPGRAYSMTRLDRLPAHRPLHSTSPSMHHLNRTQARSGETTPAGSRPGSALSHSAGAGPGPGGVVRRATPARRPRPASIAGTGVNTPRGGVSVELSAATTPSVSRDGSVAEPRRAPPAAATPSPGGLAPTPRRPRPLSLYSKPAPSPAPGEGKPPLHRKPKSSKDHDRTPRGKSSSASPGRALSPSPAVSKETSVDKDYVKIKSNGQDKRVDAAEVTQKLEALRVHNGPEHKNKPLEEKANENKDIIKATETKVEVEIKENRINVAEKLEEKIIDIRTSEEKEVNVEKPVEIIKTDILQPVEKEEQKPVDNKDVEIQKPIENKEKELHKPVEKKEEKVEKIEEKKEDKKEPSQEKTDDSEMTASMSARRIATEEEAKAALAERRRRAREELERQAELERIRLQREAEEEAERQRLEEERQRREEEEARELVALQRRTEEEKLRKAIEARQEQEREEAERKVREEAEKALRAREEQERRAAAEAAEVVRRADKQREEQERLARKQRVEAIMARTRLKKAEEEKKSQELPRDNGNEAPAEPQPSEQGADAGSPPAPAPAADNGNVTADLLGLSEHNHTEDTNKQQSNETQRIFETNNGNVNISASFIETEKKSSEHTQLPNLLPDQLQTKLADQLPNKLADQLQNAHNGHGALSHPLTLQNAI